MESSKSVASQSPGSFEALLSIPTTSTPISDPPDVPGVYIFYQDKICLYVGQSMNIARRLPAHQKKKWWAAANRLETITRLPTEDERLTRETIEILRLRPRFNQIIYLGLTKDGRIYPARF